MSNLKKIQMVWPQILTIYLPLITLHLLNTFPIHTTQKKFRISSAYLFVLSTSNVCRLWKDVQIKLKFPEDISYITIFNFCEKQLIPNGATFIVQKPFFDLKIQNIVNLWYNNVFTIIVWDCIGINAMLPVLSSFIQLYRHQKSVNFHKLRLLKNRYFTPLCLNKTPIIAIKHPLLQ